MTAQEAADKAKAGWNFFSARSAGFFFVAGAIGVVIGKSVEQMPDWATLSSFAAAAWGAVKMAAKDTGEHVTKELPGAVVIALSEKQGAQQLQIDEGKADHEKCFARHDEHESRITRSEQQIQELGGAVAELKPNWRLSGN